MQRYEKVFIYAIVGGVFFQKKNHISNQQMSVLSHHKSNQKNPKFQMFLQLFFKKI
jgi:hypothetical protein